MTVFSRTKSGGYGDMQGIIGGQIPAIPALELDGENAKQLSGGSDAEPLADND